MTAYSYEIKIPRSRVAVLIGKQGAVKKQLEHETKTRIKVDSHEGDVFVNGEDAVNLLAVKDIIIAIGRGFNPELAQLLLKQDYSLEIVNITDFLKGKDHLKRIKGRVIGQEGKARRAIEELTRCHISVFGKTIAVIGPVDFCLSARRAVEMLLRGSPHANVYRMLEKKRREMRYFEHERKE